MREALGCGSVVECVALGSISRVTERDKERWGGRKEKKNQPSCGEGGRTGIGGEGRSGW